MVGMPVFQRIGQHDLRTVFADSPDKQALVLLVIPEKTIRHTQVLPYIQLQDRGRLRGFFGPQFGRSPGPQLSPGQVNHPGLLTMHFLHKQGPCATEFYIIRVNGYRQNV
jgi:hypothetical protein